MFFKTFTTFRLAPAQVDGAQELLWFVERSPYNQPV